MHIEVPAPSANFPNGQEWQVLTLVALIAGLNFPLGQEEQEGSPDMSPYVPTPQFSHEADD